MKQFFLIPCFVVFAIALAVAQQPVFQSPYKDGRPVPENQKDYSQPVRMNLLTDGTKGKAFVVTSENFKNVQENTKENADDKTKPVLLNNSKKNNATR